MLGVKGADCQKLTLKIEQELGEVYHTEARRATPNPPPSPGPNLTLSLYLYLSSTWARSTIYRGE